MRPFYYSLDLHLDVFCQINPYRELFLMDKILVNKEFHLALEKRYSEIAILKINQMKC